MRINALLVSTLSLLAACADTTPSSVDHAVNNIDPELAMILNADIPTEAGLSHTEAATQCDLTAHLPTSLEIQQQLGDCAASDAGLACAPLSVNADQRRLRGLELAQVWTSTACELPSKEPAFFAANFDSGEVLCTAATAQARPICVR